MHTWLLHGVAHASNWADKDMVIAFVKGFSARDPNAAAVVECKATVGEPFVLRDSEVCIDHTQRTGHLELISASGEHKMVGINVQALDKLIGQLQFLLSNLIRVRLGRHIWTLRENAIGHAELPVDYDITFDPATGLYTQVEYYAKTLPRAHIFDDAVLQAYVTKAAVAKRNAVSH